MTTTDTTLDRLERLLAEECDLADLELRKWAKVPVKHIRECACQGQGAGRAGGAGGAGAGIACAVRVVVRLWASEVLQALR